MSAIKLFHHLKQTATKITPKRGHTWSRRFFFFFKLRWRRLRRVIPWWLTSIPGGHRPRCQECLKQRTFHPSVPGETLPYKTPSLPGRMGVNGCSGNWHRWRVFLHLHVLCGRMTASLVPIAPVRNKLKYCMAQGPLETFYWRYHWLFTSCYRYIPLLTTSWVLGHVREWKDGRQCDRHLP